MRKNTVVYVLIASIVLWLVLSNVYLFYRVESLSNRQNLMFDLETIVRAGSSREKAEKYLKSYGYETYKLPYYPNDIYCFDPGPLKDLSPRRIKGILTFEEDKAVSAAIVSSILAL